MLTLEREIIELRDQAVLSQQEAARLVALERRELFSIHPELRALLYVAVALITGGVGLYLRQNLERINPAVLVGVVMVAAAACYAAVILRMRRSPDRAGTLFDDYLLVLGALLLSAAVGYAESQYRVLDENWKHHLLFLAVFHAFTAYYFDSRALLTIAISALAAWFGIQPGIRWIDVSRGAVGTNTLACAAVVTVWRIANRVLGWRPHFGWVLEHFAANLSLLGALLLVFDPRREILGLVLLCAIAAVVIWWGFQKNEILFAIYGVIYLLIGVDQTVIERIKNDIAGVVYLLASTLSAILVLYWIRGKMMPR